ncbi:HET-domain-containing protein [Microthyrium microscopicum]|uniref:HET-domain-containing protein n=1 Tax=Microthyrium microscopicum TaxID=703497 RepID=A0A6A6UQM3_9PEZI|nr:HET-domain-containing protein [Microthyrium microscopicum]
MLFPPAKSNSHSFSPYFHLPATPGNHLSPFNVGSPKTNQNVPAESRLCSICSTIDFHDYFCREVNCSRAHTTPQGYPAAGQSALRLGLVEELLERSDACAFCRLVIQAICKRRQVHRWTSSKQLAEREKLKQNKTELFVYSYMFANDAGMDLVDRSSIASMNPDNAVFRIGIASRTMSNGIERADPFQDQIGVIQLAAKDAHKIGKSTRFHGRPFNNGPVDIGLAKYWINICQDAHGKLCDINSTIEPEEDVKSTRPKELYVVDVQRLCVKKLPPRARYVALSYCWPIEGAFSTVRSNLSALEAPGALSKNEFGNKLPLAVQNAIQLVDMLEESYLWVDSLCIVQDDDMQKAIQIAQMDSIYSWAFLTAICAPDRTDLSQTMYAGLPGFRSSTPRPRQAIEHISGLTLMTAFMDVTSVLDYGRWITRAWTFQEHMLSPRKLYFTDTQMYFQCDAMFCEDSVGERASTLTRYYPGSNLFNKDQFIDNPGTDFGYCLIPRRSDIKLEVARRSCFNLLGEYGQRGMSFSNDILNAFQGIMAIFQRSLNTEFIYGLPEIWFHDALLWMGTTDPVRRKTAKLDGKTTVMPSWSWAGWHWSSFGFSADEFLEKTVRPEVDWVAVFMDGLKTKLRCAYKNELGDLVTQDLESSRNIGPMELAPQSILEARYWNYAERGTRPQWNNLDYLMCWTSVASFILTGDCISNERVLTGRPFTSRQLLIVSDEHGRSIGYTIMSEKWKDENIQAPMAFEFMLISRLKSKPNFFVDLDHFSPKDWAYVVVMLIARRDNDKASRLGIGLIHEDAWISSPKITQLIKLQ